MLRKSKIYLDTSVISFLYADDAPDKRDITIDFFRDFIRTAIYETYISDFVVAEIENTTDLKHKQRMLSVIADYNISFLELNNRPELDELAANYIKEGIIPEKKLLDAYHIAVAVTNQINILVSWNYKHLANVNRERRINVVNLAKNYLNEIRIITSLELMDYEN
jgi:predicted nucleic acid-binding protein